MTETQKQLILSTWKPPFKYNADLQMIFDANNELVLNVRGWGKVQYMDDSELRQDTFGEFVAESMNEKLSK